MKNYFTSDQIQLWLMADPPIPIDAQVGDMRRRYTVLGEPQPRWEVTIESVRPETIKRLRDFQAGCRLIVTHFEVNAWRRRFDASSIIARMNDCYPVDAEIDYLVTYEDAHSICYRLNITCEVELLPEPS